MTYHRICNKSNRTGATDGAGSAYPSGRLITTFVTGQVPLMEQEVLTLSEHLILSYVLRGVRVFLSTINELFLLQLKCCRGFIYYGKIPSYNIREQLEKYIV